MKTILYVVTFVMALFVASLGTNAASFSNTTSISIRDTNTAVPYPSIITVSGLTGTVSVVTIQLSGFSHGSPSDVKMLLVSPTGNKFVFFSDAGGTNSIFGVTVAFADSGASLVPSSSLFAGTYKPTDYGGLSDVFASPSPAVNFGDLASIAGTTTYANQFRGTDPNGVWSLYIMDDVHGSSGTLANGWTLSLTTTPPASTLTTLQSSPNPSFDSPPTNTVVFSAVVKSSGVPVAQGTVAFNDGATLLAANVSLDANGHAGYTNSTFAKGSHVITASYNGTAGFTASTSSGVTQIVNTRTLVLTNISVIPSKQFQFGFTGITMAVYTVLASTNLANWSALGPADEMSPGQYRYVDHGISNFTRRFYRVQEP